MTDEKVVQRLQRMKIFHEKNEGNIKALNAAIRQFRRAEMVGDDWESFISDPPKREREGDIFEIYSERFKEPILAELCCDKNGKNLFFCDMYGSSFDGYLNYREVTE